MRYKTACNPFFWFAAVWAAVLLLYPLRLSGLYEPLDTGLLCFLIGAVCLALCFGALYGRLLPDRLRPRGKSEFPHAAVMLARPTCYALEFLYAGRIPLADELTGTGSYLDFGGIPTFHVLLVTFSLFYAVLLFSSALGAKRRGEKRQHWIGFCTVLVLMATQYNRGLLLMTALCCAVVYLFCRGLRPAALLRLFGLGAAALYAFGGLGNLRAGRAWNDSSYLFEVARIDGSRYPAFLPQEFAWAYVYLVSPLGNLNHFVRHFSPRPDLAGFLGSLLPDAIYKRTFGKIPPFPLPEPNLNVSTGFADAYRFGGFAGMAALFFALSLFLLCVGRLSVSRQEGFPVAHALLCCVAALMFFTNMLVYTGLTFALVYALLPVRRGGAA